jgi:hypothetical protein
MGIDSCQEITELRKQTIVVKWRTGSTRYERDNAEYEYAPSHYTTNDQPPKLCLLLLYHHCLIWKKKLHQHHERNWELACDSCRPLNVTDFGLVLEGCQNSIRTPRNHVHRTVHQFINVSTPVFFPAACALIADRCFPNPYCGRIGLQWAAGVRMNDVQKKQRSASANTRAAGIFQRSVERTGRASESW